MGCDIHVTFEVRKRGKWEAVPVREKYRTGKQYDDGGHEIDYEKYFDDPLYVGRNYNLFAILANVRNGYGFAGCVTGLGYKPIAGPRNYPPDASPEARTDSDGYGSDGHSHSWVTLAELLSYDWDQTTVSRGVVTPEEYRTFKEKGKPTSWSGNIMGDRIVKVDNDEMDVRLAAGTAGSEEVFDKPMCVTAVTWTEPYRNSVGDFLTRVVPAMQKLGKPEDVRMVFFFDN